MGLAGPNKRRRIGTDPNNTSWSSNEESFGRKMLEAQGWTPGSYLGAKNAAHAEHFSAANASHVRVLLKEDNLGLGAKRGKTTDDSTFGLFALQDIYGRLNGKTEVELVKEQNHRADLSRKLYMDQRWGPSRFVRGGFLVGDKIEDIKSPSLNSNIIEIPPALDVDKANVNLTTLELKHESKAKPKKRQKARNRREVIDELEASNNASGSERLTETKAERKVCREERRLRKARKIARQVEEDQSKVVIAIPGQLSMPAAGLPAEQQMSTPLEVKPATAQDNRNAVRSRFIKQKRLACMDARALREILMLKARPESPS